MVVWLLYNCCIIDEQLLITYDIKSTLFVMISNQRTGKTKLATLGVQGIYDAKDPSMMSELRPDNREGIP